MTKFGSSASIAAICVGPLDPGGRAYRYRDDYYSRSRFTAGRLAQPVDKVMIVGLVDKSFL